MAEHPLPLKSPEWGGSHALILAGGSGTRFWPLSRAGCPKQLLKIWDDRTLIEHTVDRLRGENPAFVSQTIVTTQALVEGTQKALGDRAREVVFLGEPAGKNTAACILWGLLDVARRDPQGIVCVLPADHYVGKEAQFREALSLAVDVAKSERSIVTLGIQPTRPETGYGYIQRRPGSAQDRVFGVERFVEKPELRQAQKYLAEGNFLWNAGIFVFSVSTGIEAFQKCMPQLFDVFTGIETNSIESVYQQISARDVVSFDIGVMESVAQHGIGVRVVPVSCDWNDLGSFTALEDIEKAITGKMVSHNAASNIVHTDEGLIALLGVNDLIVVREGPIVLVAAKDQAQAVRNLVDRVKKDFPHWA